MYDCLLANYVFFLLNRPNNNPTARSIHVAPMSVIMHAKATRVYVYL